MSLLQHCFTADAKFLTSFRTIAISIMTWCGLYIFFLFNFGTTLSLLSFFNRDLRQRRSMHVNRKWDLYLSFIKLCHETHISIPNSLNRTLCPKIWASYCSAEYCPRMQKTHFRLTCVRLKTSFKLTIKLPELYKQAQRCISAFPFVTWSPKPASRARRLNLWYPVHARLHSP